MGDVRQHVLGPADDGKTVAAVVRALQTPSSWSAVRRMIATRRVSMNGSVCLDPSRRVQQGEVIEFFAESLPPIPKARDVKVEFCDEHLIVVDKPPGIMTVRPSPQRNQSPGDPTTETVLIELAEEIVLNMPSRTGSAVIPVHRLDRNTSGLMMFALSRDCADRLISLFRQHHIQREYLAVATGTIAAGMTIRSHLVRDRGDGLRGTTNVPTDDSQLAITHIEPLEQLAGKYTIVRCNLETGRTHQIRIHLAESGHMLCGERRYTRAAPNAAAVVDKSGAPRHALHSARLEFTHPITGQAMRFKSPWPRDLRKWLEVLKVK
jgi:23S rRNA pseudouridine1911/1915/1917 synthase